MGDRLATIDMGRKEGAAVPLSGGGAGYPSNTMCPGPRSTSETKSMHHDQSSRLATTQ